MLRVEKKMLIMIMSGKSVFECVYFMRLLVLMWIHRCVLCVIVDAALCSECGYITCCARGVVQSHAILGGKAVYR